MSEEILNTEPAKTLELIVLPSDAVTTEVEMDQGDENVVSIIKSGTEYNFSAVHPGKTRVITRATDSSLVTNILEVEVTSSQSINVHFNDGEEGTFKTYYRDIPDTEQDYFETYSYYGDDREYKTVYFQLGNVYKFESVSHEEPCVNQVMEWWTTFGSSNIILKCLPLETELENEKAWYWEKDDGTLQEITIQKIIHNILTNKGLEYYGSSVNIKSFPKEIRTYLSITGQKITKIGDAIDN